MSIVNKVLHSKTVAEVAKLIPDKMYIKLKYRWITGEKLDLNNPISFNEKIQWLKLYDRKDIYCKYADKYEVKLIMNSLIGEKYIIPNLAVWDKVEDINIIGLPEKFVLKTTHDSGGVVICENKELFDLNKAKKKLKKSTKRNYYWHGREWPYKNLYPRIIAEPLMVDESGYQLKDYKVFLFNGKPKYVEVDYDRFTNHHRNFYSTDWQYIPFTTLYPTNSNIQIKKPQNLDKLISLSKKIADSIKNPPFVRVDFYIVNNNIYFGEVTFYHGSGTEKFYPEEYNIILGNMINFGIISTSGAK